MALLANSPVPVRILADPRWEVGMDPGGVGGAMGFHVGAGVAAVPGDPGVRAGLPSDIYTFLDFIGGTTEAVTIGGVVVQRIVPLRHPYLTNMVAQRVRAVGTGQPLDGAPGSTDAKVMVDFGVPPYPFAGDTPYSVLRHRGDATAITRPGRAYAVGGVFLNHDIATSLPGILFSFTLYQVPTLNIDLYTSLCGKVNDAVFLGRAAGTVRFDSFEDEIATTIAFTQTQTVSLALAWRPRPWNEVLLPNGVWAEPVNVNDGSKLHAPADLSSLLY